MRAFDELTDKEVAELTQEEIDEFCKFELMQEGCVIPPVPKQPEIIEPTEALRRETYHQVTAGKGYAKSCVAGAVFKTLEQAQAFLDLEPYDTDYDYRVGSQYQHAERLRDPSIAPVVLYVKDDIDKIKPLLTANTAKKEAYSKDVAARDKAVESSARITEWITNKWLECRQNLRHYTSILATFAEYLAMTDNDKSVATRFLIKAHGREKLRAVAEWFGEESGLDTALLALLVEPEEEPEAEKEEAA